VLYLVACTEVLYLMSYNTNCCEIMVEFVESTTKQTILTAYVFLHDVIVQLAAKVQ